MRDTINNHPLIQDVKSIKIVLTHLTLNAKDNTFRINVI